MIREHAVSELSLGDTFCFEWRLPTDLQWVQWTGKAISIQNRTADVEYYLLAEVPASDDEDATATETTTTCQKFPPVNKNVILRNFVVTRSEVNWFFKE
jgi:hypothetical protein